MGYVDMAVGTAFFLFFLAMVLLITIQHFVKYPAVITVQEYRDKAIDMFEQFFTKLGIPSNWEDSGVAPAELGLIVKVHVRPILLREVSNISRENEPVIVNLLFDEDCEDLAWNNTVRLYTSDLKEVGYEFVNPKMCPTSQFLNESYIRFNVSMSEYEEKTLFAYYYDDDSIPAPNYTITYSTTGWVPSDGDSWSESITYWDRYGGSTGSPETNSSTKMRGDYSIRVRGTFDNKTLGLNYDPMSNITGVANGWYIDSWIYLDDTSGVSAVNVSIKDASETIVTTIDISNFINGEWYHFERELDSTKWDSWVSFNASDGIDSISFYMINSTSGITRELRVDEVHFELEPLDVAIYPEEFENVVSSKKISALTSLSYEDLKRILGEDYRFRIEIID